VSSPVSQPERAPLSASSAEPRDFDAVYAEFFPFVWRCLRGLGVPESGLDDAAQDVFVIVHRKLADFRGGSSLRTWLYGIVRNVASNRRRSLTRQGHAAELDERLPSVAPGPLERAQAAQAAAFVAQFLATGEPKRCEVFMLALVEDMSMPEVATALGIPLNTAYSRLRLARIDFQAALEERRR
jgi:RNA polymerase sigma-70 factor (ECF subfamily)